MKQLFALILILLSNSGWSQEAPKIYDWEVAKYSHPDTIFGISFEKLKLDKLPNELADFTNLRTLNLKKNKLTELPDYFRNFKQLTSINIEKNELQAFPLQFCQLINLEEIIIGRNQISSLPACIERLKNLKHLDLYDNPIGSFPESLAKLQQLEKIDVTGIRFNLDFQKKWSKLLPNTTFDFDPPCDCMN